MKMNNRSIVCILLLLYSIGFAEDRKFPYADAVPFLDMERVVKVVKQTVFAVQMTGDQKNKNKKDDWKSIGSGFLIREPNKPLLGVTCKHVISEATKRNKAVFIGMDTDKGYRRFPCKIAYIDPNNDIAIIEPLKNDQEDITLEQIFSTNESFGDDSSLIEGRGIIIPGYPLSLGIEDDKNHPVIRFGIIAQFTGKKTFLIDGVANPGNSGSPVFTLKYPERELVGMVISHITYNIPLYDKNGQVQARLPFNSGLARAISIKVIKEAIQKVE